MGRNLFFSLLILFFLVGYAGCSDDGVACGSGICGSNEVCEDGECVLGIFIEGEDEDSEGCEEDADCPAGKICTNENSVPARACIPSLSCDTDQDCQSGLSCESDGVCR